MSFYVGGLVKTGQLIRETLQESGDYSPFSSSRF